MAESMLETIEGEIIAGKKNFSAGQYIFTMVDSLKAITTYNALVKCMAGLMKGSFFSGSNMVAHL